MTRWRDLSPRLAGSLSRQPLRIAIAALVVGALGATGLLRFEVDAGQSLLVGSASSAGQTYAAFSQTFGSDPIVLVFSTQQGGSTGNPAAPYYEGNLERLGALELDLVHDPRVASVLGPGTIAGSLRSAAVSEVSKVLTEYPYFVAETDYLTQLQQGNTNQSQLQSRLQSDITTATTLLELYVVKAASDAHNARAQYAIKAGDTVLDSQEKAVDAGIANDAVPPLWDQYLAGPGQPTNSTAAKQFFDRVAAAYGDCDDEIATLLKIQPTCQYFFDRTLLDLPNCPKVSSSTFCNPKPQWAAVLPVPKPDMASYEIVTVRLKPAYVGGQAVPTTGCPNPCDLVSLQSKITDELAHGISSDSYTQKLSASTRNTLKSLGALAPSQCGGQSSQQAPACVTQFHDARLSYVMAGAPLLGVGVIGSMTQLLLILLPVALLVMLLLLIGVFRVRGRVWPLLGAAAATVLTIGVTLLVGAGVTPAVLAGVPVLIGLGVDYAVQLVARYTEERAAGATIPDSLQRVVGNTGRATFVAAAATLAGLAALALFSGIDWGPLVAVPLVAEFALVLCGGVVLAWLGGLFVALPLAAWSDRRRPIEVAATGRVAAAPARPALRTIAIADNWRGITALGGVLAVAGWAALHFIPVQTDVQQLLASSLPELGNIQTVQAETGYTNEIDIYLHGPVVTGTIDTRTGTPTNVEWQCAVAALVRTEHQDTVAEATSIGDYVIASGSTTSGPSSDQCVPSASSSSPSPSPSPSASGSPAPGTSASPSATRATPGAARLAAQVTAELTAATATPSPASTALPSPVATAATSATPRPSASATPSPSAATPVQSAFVCDLRLFPALARTLVMPIGVDTLSCPPVDEYQQTFLTKDSTPVSPDSARIALGVHTESVAAQAQLVHQLLHDVAASSPPSGISAAPTGLAVLATTAYDNLTNGAYLLNLAPLVVVAVALLLIYREPRRALLPVLPTAMAAGWAPLLLLLLGHLPGVPAGVTATLGSLNPLTVVLGALVVALGTEFGVVLLGRFYEERQRGLDPDAAAAAALGGVGRAIRVSALTLGAGFAVLALSGLFPNSLPLVADFGLAVVIDLALAVAAVFLVMLPVAVALERSRPLDLVAEPAPAVAAPRTPPATRGPRAGTAKRAPRAPKAAAPAVEEEQATVGEQAPARRAPGVSGRKRVRREETPIPPEEPTPPRRPGVSGRRRRQG